MLHFRQIFSKVFLVSPLSLFFAIYVKFFFILSPLFVLSVFLSLTKEMSRPAMGKLALRTTVAILIASFVLFFFGEGIFKVLGITIDSFRIGAGALLFLSAVSLIQDKKIMIGDEVGDPAVVPLAIPVTVGPATTGMLLVMGAETKELVEMVVSLSALFGAVVSTGILLYLGSYLEQLIGKIGISILTKLTGLFLAALSAEIIFTGVKNSLTL